MNLQTSIRRTVVPMAMGWIASLPIAPLVDQQQVEAALVVLLGATYYTVLRWLEDRGVDAAGWWIAFGRTSAPEYPDAV
jgi:glucan biosynthesis protein